MQSPEIPVGKSIDSLDFARSAGRLDGRVALTSLPRLGDMLMETEGWLQLNLSGERDDEGKHWLHLELSGELQLCCQRCLNAVAVPVAVEAHLQLVPPGTEWPDEDLEDDGADAIAAEKELDVLSLAEDEILLSLPIAARHEICKLPQSAATNESLSPFAALAGLKMH
ncbi:MAG TPA: YceD family protein [Rhodocyclaceae bacterium]|nr:YceD family protein [Rhodocyclaceae bacterium]